MVFLIDVVFFSIFRIQNRRGHILSIPASVSSTQLTFGKNAFAKSLREVPKTDLIIVG